jgi:anti-anti-sigma factor
MTRTTPELPSFRLTTDRSGGRCVIAAHGELDMASAPELTATVRSELAAMPVLLDLRELSFMDSSGVRALDGLVREAAKEGWTFTISPALQDQVRQVLGMTGMLETLPMDREDA